MEASNYGHDVPQQQGAGYFLPGNYLNVSGHYRPGWHHYQVVGLHKPIHSLSVILFHTIPYWVLSSIPLVKKN